MAAEQSFQERYEEQVKIAHAKAANGKCLCRICKPICPRCDEDAIMNEYEQKQEERRERYLERAENAEKEAEGRFETARRITSVIPMGQPILIGHHSERHHRADLARHDRNMRAGIEASDKAEYYRRRAAAVGNSGVSSDDPDAIDKLRERVAKLEATQARMVAVNKLVRKNDRDGLRALGLTDEAIEGAFTPDFCGRIGFASYQLTNNGANIRRLKERIAQLEQNAQRETIDREFPTAPLAPGLRVVENAEANRVQLVFDAKPSDEVRARLKMHGFRWSPREGAWQRHLNNAGIFAAQQIVNYLAPKAETAPAATVSDESYCKCGHGAPCMNCAE